MKNTLTAILDKIEETHEEIRRTDDYDHAQCCDYAICALCEVLKEIQGVDPEKIVKRLEGIIARRRRNKDIAGTPKLPYEEVMETINHFRRRMYQRSNL